MAVSRPLTVSFPLKVRKTQAESGDFTVLVDAALKNLRPRTKAYKSSDRDGMYAYVSPGGAISFRYDYRFNGRRETVTLGRYGRGGLTLAQARERLFDIKRTIAEGASPAIEKQRAKRRLQGSRSFEPFGMARLQVAAYRRRARASIAAVGVS